MITGCCGGVGATGRVTVTRAAERGLLDRDPAAVSRDDLGDDREAYRVSWILVKLGGGARC